MYKRLALVLIALAVVAACGFKNRKGYYYDNQRFNYVRLEKFKDAKNRNINHPAIFSEAEISTILKTVEIKKGVALSKDEKIKNIFDSKAISKMTTPIVKAFSEATPEQKIGFAFLVKNPKIILKDDRFTDGWMWVEDDKLHVQFGKIYVKVTGDTDKRGIQSERQVEQARGLEVALDIGAGQEFGDSTRELVIDRGVYSKLTEQRIAKEKELAEKGVDADVEIRIVKDKTSRERLKELKILRDEKVITQEEFEKKRKEILGDL